MRLKRQKLLVPLLLLVLASLLCACAGRTESGPSALDAAREAALEGHAPDFTALRELNPDIVAWLSAPNASISEPVLQRAGDDSYYASHAPDGTQNAGGSVYSQSGYNSADFTDPVTVLYGSEATPGRQFSSLMKTFSEDGSLSRADKILVYTPEGTLKYQAFAAGLFNSSHLLHDYHGFRDTNELESFLSAFRNYHAISRQLDETVTLSDSDQLLILSTHVPQNEDLRFLVVARLVA